MFIFSNKCFQINFGHTHTHTHTHARAHALPFHDLDLNHAELCVVGKISAKTGVVKSRNTLDQ